jgi:hypothetical protein
MIEETPMELATDAGFAAHRGAPRWPIRLAIAWAAFALTAATLVSPAGAGPLNAHGATLRIVAPPRSDATQSGNWFGYGQSAVHQGVKLFRSITASWTIPRASQHTKGQAEYSSDWIGIGGGCVTAGCTVGDTTLIQTGTEQDVSVKGKPSYSAWWETIPAPSTTIPTLKVAPGNRMRAAITETAPQVWKIMISDLTRKESFSKTVPYSSSQDTAEWIEETPLIVGSNAGFAALPNLTAPSFDRATVNGHLAHLNRSQEIDLTNSRGKEIGVPSPPDRASDGFNACAWARTCRAPTSNLASQ